MRGSVHHTLMMVDTAHGACNYRPKGMTVHIFYLDKHNRTPHTATSKAFEAFKTRLTAAELTEACMHVDSVQKR